MSMTIVIYIARGKGAPLLAGDAARPMRSSEQLVTSGIMPTCENIANVMHDALACYAFEKVFLHRKKHLFNFRNLFICLFV